MTSETSENIIFVQSTLPYIIIANRLETVTVPNNKFFSLEIFVFPQR